MLRAQAEAAFLVSLLLLTNGCKPEPPADAAGYAYIAPQTINLRPALTDRSNSVALLNHGERVRILEVRRRFAKIQSGKGAEGWIDATQLLTPEQMEEIRKASARALQMPSEGSATVFEALNVHLDPNRQAPAFARIPDAGSVEVLAHRLSPKVSGLPVIPVFTLPANAAAVARKERKERRAKSVYRLPARPPAPKAPASAPVMTPKASTAEKPEDAKKPVQLEDWTLVRTRNKQCGWVLSRNLIMSIPDEVAQYAEGKRITSYFDLGVIQDEEKGQRHNWLWTTSSRLQQADFDAWRVFLWNRHRHRYETSFRERDVEGFFPVHVDAADHSSPVRTFDLILKEENGKLLRRHYVFDGVRVHLTGQEAYDPGKPEQDPAPVTVSGKGSQPGRNWLRQKWSDFRKRLKGGA